MLDVTIRRVSEADCRAAVVREVVLAQTVADYWKAMAADGSRVAPGELARARRRIASGLALLAETEGGR